MGQIVSSASKPKRCNLNKLSQLGILAAGEHVLVSYDNSMNAAGQGNFDRYIVGDGRTAATALELKYLDDSTRPYIVEEVNKAVADIQPIEITGDVTNAPDEEDLTSVQQGNTDVLKFKDKTYNAALYSGLGRVYLRKNIVTLEGTGKNVLTQAMVNATNTIYHIQYDYDLNGQTITLPAGCVLDFEGGSLKNGALVGNGTKIVTSGNNLFYNITIDGTWNNTAVSSKWFIDANSPNCLFYIFKLTSDDVQNTVVIEDGNYLVDGDLANYTSYILSNTRVVLNGTITVDSHNKAGIIPFRVSGDNIVIEGNGSIIGDRYTNTNTGDWGPLIYFSGACSNVRISGITIKNSFGDGISCAGVYNKRVEICYCVIDSARRNGIVIKHGELYNIHDNIIMNTDGVNPKAAIDVEVEEDSVGPLRNIIISNNVFDNNIIGITCNPAKDAIDGLVIKNNLFNFNNENVISTHLFCSGSAQRRLYRLEVANNKCTGYGRIFLASIDNAIISGNNITSPSTDISSSSGVFRIDDCANLDIRGNRIETVGRSVFIISSSNHVNFIGNYISSETECFNNSKLLYSIFESNVWVGKFISRASYNSYRRNTFTFSSNVDFNINIGVSSRQLYGVIFEDNIISNPNNYSGYCIYANLSSSSLKNNIFPDTANKIFFVKGSDTNFTETLSAGNTLPTTLQPFNKGTSCFYPTIERNVYWNGTKWVDEKGYTPAIKKGTTEQRPTDTLTTSDAGYQYFDTTLGKPIYWNGTTWVDAMRTAV